jgi:hypothetical protein
MMESKDREWTNQSSDGISAQIVQCKSRTVGNVIRTQVDIGIWHKIGTVGRETTKGFVHITDFALITRLIVDYDAASTLDA